MNEKGEKKERLVEDWLRGEEKVEWIEAVGGPSQGHVVREESGFRERKYRLLKLNDSLN
jgi:hypothetical protein